MEVRAASGKGCCRMLGHAGGLRSIAFMLMLLIGTLVASCGSSSSTPVNPLLGTWVKGDFAQPDNLQVIWFLDGHTYAMAIDQAADANGQDGIEYGFYSWDKTAGTITVKPSINTAGNWGIVGMAAPVKMSIVDNKLTIGSASYTRLINGGGDPVQGGWLLGDVILFAFDNGHYVMADAYALYSNSSCGKMGGIERGAYTYSGDYTSGTMTIPIQSVFEDTNGCWGFNDSTKPSSLQPDPQVAVGFNNNLMSWTAPIVGGTAYFTRVQ